MSDQGVEGLATAVNLAGSITATSRAQVTGRLAFNIAGRITATSRASGSNVFNIAGRITANSRALISGTFSVTTYVNLGGTITANSRARFSGSYRLFLYGQIQASAAARATFLAVRLAGHITAVAQAGASMPPQLAGLIHAQSVARFQRPLFPTGPGSFLGLTGRISASAAARIQLPNIYPIRLQLSGSIYGNSSAQLATAPYYTLRLSGKITSTSMAGGLAGPWQPYLVGIIKAAAQTFFAIAEVQQPLPPYPPPFLTHVTDDYLNFITSEHNQRPKYLATVGISVDPLVQDQQLVAGIAGLFDLDYSVGEQEDFTGQWIGKSRWIELPNVFFSWDTEGVGWNQGNWKGPADAGTVLERLDDYHYRLLLYATVIANHWDGSIPNAYAAWDTLFQYTGLKVIIQDYGNMTMLYGLLSTTELDAVLVSMFLSGQMDLRPEGVELRAYALQPTPGVPFFSWDSTSDSVHGWDTGSWGIMQPPE
jgi:Protein of unknown function (DUF2612)